MGPPPVHRGFFHQWGWKKAGMAARKAEEKRRGHRAAVPPARPMRRHRPREGGKRSIGTEAGDDLGRQPRSAEDAGEADGGDGQHLQAAHGNGRKIAHVANGVIRTGKNDSGASPRAWGCFHHTLRNLLHSGGFPHARGGAPLQIIAMVAVTSSPRTWGCFLQRQGG